MDLNVTTLDPKKLWNNKFYEEEQDINKDYVSGLKDWEVNYLGITKVSKEDKKKLLLKSPTKGGFKSSPKKKWLISIKIVVMNLG